MNELQNININDLNVMSNEPYQVKFTNTLSKTTQRTYRSDITNFFKAFFGIKKFEDITDIMILKVDIDMANEWKRQMIQKGLKPATINKKLAALESFYKYLCRRNVPINVPYNPFSSEEGCDRIKNAIVNYSGKTDLSGEEVEMILNMIPQTCDNKMKNLINKRDYIAITFMLATGVRRDELTGIKLGDFSDAHGSKVVKVLGKGKKYRVIKVPNSIYNNICQYAELRYLTMNDTEEYMLSPHTPNLGIRVRGLRMSNTSVNNLVDKYVKAAGLEGRNITPHSFRHTFCTTSLRKDGIRIEDVQDEMGHSKVETTRRYDHINRTIENSTTDYVAKQFGL